MNYLSMSVLDSGVPGRYPTETGAATLTMPAATLTMQRGGQICSITT